MAPRLGARPAGACVTLGGMSVRRALTGHHPARRPLPRRLPVALALALALLGAGGAPASATPAPAGPVAVVLPAAATEAPEEQEEAPEEDTAPPAPEVEEGTSEGDGPQPIVWFLAAAAILALALGAVVMTRGQRTRP